MSEAKKRLLKKYKEKHGRVPSGFSDPDAAPAMTPEQGAMALSELVKEREAREAREAAAGGGGSEAQQPAASGGDYFAEVAKVARERGIKRTEAQRVILREQPDLWKQMLRRANPHKTETQLFGEGV